jgi:2,3-dihydroxy-2,3-dihydrophenylpropionate dehydrogenase
MRRSALVTGGASGIGRAVVDRFAAAGYAVVVLDRQRPSSMPAEVSVVVGDVTTTEANENAVARAVGLTGGLDVFVGNAGVHDGGRRLLDQPSEDLAAVARRVLEIDVIGYLLGARATAEPLAERNGCMIFTLSDASFVVSGNGAGVAYCAAKHAALGLMRHLAADLAPRVRVNAVAPGGVITGLRSVDRDDGDHQLFTDPEGITEQVRRLNPLGLILTPEQLAESYLFLASEAAAGMTGEVLRPDGGLGVR